MTERYTGDQFQVCLIFATSACLCVKSTVDFHLAHRAIARSSKKFQQISNRSQSVVWTLPNAVIWWLKPAELAGHTAIRPGHWQESDIEY